jgi:1-acyl-sn-glycerol-3-phosphate acyltransferase
VSYNLRHGVSVLIDRKDKERSIKAIEEFAINIKLKNHSAVIFPEGTRSRDGKLKRFSENGLRTLVESCPDAVIVPVSIDNSWQLQKYGMFPLPVGLNIKFKVHKPIEGSSHSFDQIFEYCKSGITKALE